MAFAQPSEPVCEMVIRFSPTVGSMYWNAAKYRQLEFVLCMDTLKEQVKVQNYIQPPQINPYGILQFHLSLVPLSSGGYFHGLDDLSYGVDLHRIRWCGILQVIKHVTCLYSACWQILGSESHYRKLLLRQMRIFQHCCSCWWTMPAVTCTVQLANIWCQGWLVCQSEYSVIDPSVILPNNYFDFEDNVPVRRHLLESIHYIDDYENTKYVIASKGTQLCIWTQVFNLIKVFNHLIYGTWWMS